MAGVLDALVGELATRLKHDSPTGTPSEPYMHGPGGLFSMRGLERDLISTRIQPRGLADILPAVGTVVTNPLFGYITSFADVIGSEKEGVCDDPPVAGALSNCVQTAQFGRYERRTRELEINSVGQQTDRAEFLDLRLINDPLVKTDGLGLFTPQSAGTSLQLARDVLSRFVEVGVAFQNLLTPQTWLGNPANNSSGGGYKEFPGLDILIGTGKVDALTGTSCPSLDSQVWNFNYAAVDNYDADVVKQLTYMLRYLRANASRGNFDPVTWTIAMREGLFYELSSMWPCSYMTYACIARDNATVNINANDYTAMRDAMRQGQYLVIDGTKYNVVFDDGIVEESATDNSAITSGSFASNIYVIPMTVRGGIATTYWEYLDYSRGAMVGAADARMANDDFWTDGGRFLWHKKPPTNWCVQFLAKIEPRLIIRTPHLAGRLENVQYSPLIHNRDPFPGNPYNLNDGVASRPGPSLYTEWNQA